MPKIGPFNNPIYSLSGVTYFWGAGAYYEFLMKNKLSQNVSTLNSKKILHTQHDYHLYFYTGKNDVYIVTQENKIKTLGLNNVISFEEYLSKVLPLSFYWRIKRFFHKIFRCK